MRGLGPRDAARFSFLIATPGDPGRRLYSCRMLGPWATDPGQALGVRGVGCRCLRLDRFPRRFFETRTLLPFAAYWPGGPAGSRSLASSEASRTGLDHDGAGPHTVPGIGVGAPRGWRGRRGSHPEWRSVETASSAWRRDRLGRRRSAVIGGAVRGAGARRGENRGASGPNTGSAARGRRRRRAVVSVDRCWPVPGRPRQSLLRSGPQPWRPHYRPGYGKGWGGPDGMNLGSAEIRGAAPLVGLPIVPRAMR